MGVNLSTEEFIKRAKTVHGDLYRYDNVIYVSAHKKVSIFCCKHGSYFSQSPANHLAGKGCPKCGDDRVREFRRGSTKSFIEAAKKVHGDTYNYDKVAYVAQKVKVLITCKEHGDFLQEPRKHLSGNGCKACGTISAGKKNADNIDSFIKKAKKVHGDKYDYSKSVYLGAHNDIEIVCPVHGSFWQRASHHLEGRGCKECTFDGYRVLYTKSKEEFIRQSIEVHGSKYDYSKVEYVNNVTPVIIICPEHGEFLQTPTNHSDKKCGCPECSKDLMGWKYTAWEKRGLASKGFDGFRFYILECWDDNERFYKVGKTFQSVKRRFHKKGAMPYEFRVVYEEVGSARYISELESLIKNLNKEEAYLPNLDFGGKFECFKKVRYE